MLGSAGGHDGSSLTSDLGPAFIGIGYERRRIENSCKLIVLSSLLESSCVNNGEQVVVVCSSTQALDIIADACENLGCVSGGARGPA